MERAYPLRLSPSLHVTIWAGHRLAREGWKQTLSPDAPVGESWETEESNVILNGTYAGSTLGELVRNLGSAFLGEAAVHVFGRRFPLLAKFADMADPVSVHVHPDDAYALRRAGHAWGKPEFFYVLDAAPNSTITHGFTSDTTRDAVRASVAQGTLEAMLRRMHIRAGDAIFVAPGTIHSVGSGVILYEIQAYSDVTYRLYDYGRRSADGRLRPLSIDEGLDVLHYHPSDRVTCEPAMVASTLAYDEVALVACEQFVTRKLDLRESADGGAMFVDTTQSSCVVLSSVGGTGVIRYGDALAETEVISKGETLVLPADLGAYALQGSGVLLASYVPDRSDRVVALWRRANGLPVSE